MKLYAEQVSMWFPDRRPDLYSRLKGDGLICVWRGDAKTEQEWLAALDQAILILSVMREVSTKDDVPTSSSEENGALTEDKRIVTAYAKFLADKLAQDGQEQQADILRRYAAGDFGAAIRMAALDAKEET